MEKAGFEPSTFGTGAEHAANYADRPGRTYCKVSARAPTISPAAIAKEEGLRGGEGLLYWKVRNREPMVGWSAALVLPQGRARAGRGQLAASAPPGPLLLLWAVAKPQQSCAKVLRAPCEAPLWQFWQ